MKLIKYIIFGILIITFDSVVHAYENTGYNINKHNSCKGTSCILLCAYNNNRDNNDYSSYIYYDLKTESFFTEWFYINYRGEVSKKIQYVTNNYTNVFFDILVVNNLKNNGICPEKSFIDNSGASTEVCFGSENYCLKQDPGGLGTKFTGESIIKYNYGNDIEKYFVDYAIKIEKYSCDIERITIKENILKEFEISWLNGHKMPDFIKNSDSYKIQYLDTALNNFSEKCIKEWNEKVESGEITETEKNDKIEKFDQIISDSKEEIKELNGIKLDVNDFENCSSLLGDPNTEKTPSWYLSFAFSIIRYIAIILLIVMTMMDFISATASQDADILKKATNKAIKRAVLCVIIFILPTLISVILKFVHEKATLDCIRNV